jgi:hypothetical protein
VPAYRYLVGDLNPSSGNGLRDEVPFSTVRFSRILNRPGGFAATIPLRHPKATRANLDPGRTAVHVERDGVIVWSGVLWTARASVEGAALDVGGEGWWSYFRRRRLRATKAYAAQDQLAIARDLVNWAQAQQGGNVGVVVGSETSGVVRDRTYWHYERKPIGEAVEQLAAVEDGFDFAVDVAYEAGVIVKRLRLHYPRRGRITPLVWDLGANLEGLSQEVDAARAANVVDALGAGEGDSMLIATAADTSQLASYPLLEDTVSLKDVSGPATLQAHAALELANRARPATTLPTLLARQANPDTALGTFLEGDSVRVKASDGWVAVDARMRVQSYEVSVDQDGREQVAVAFAEEEASVG